MHHVSHQGQQFGPYTVEQINEYLAQGAFDASSHVWDANANQWIEIWKLPGVVLASQAVPITPPQGTQPSFPDQLTDTANTPVIHEQDSETAENMTNGGSKMLSKLKPSKQVKKACLPLLIGVVLIVVIAWIDNNRYDLGIGLYVILAVFFGLLLNSGQGWFAQKFGNDEKEPEIKEKMERDTLSAHADNYMTRIIIERRSSHRFGAGRNMLVVADDEEVALLGVGESREIHISSDKKELWVKMDWMSSAKLTITHDGNVYNYVCGEEGFFSGFIGMFFWKNKAFSLRRKESS